MKHRILIIEDEADIGGPLSENLAAEGYEVETRALGVAGLDCARSWRPTLVVLDLMLPDISGESVLMHLREEGQDMPVLILSAQQGELTKVRGFRLGADDYVTKPFGLLEFLARIDALIRRAASSARRATIVNIGDVSIDVTGRRVLRAGMKVDLRPREMSLLLALVECANQVVPRKRLLEEVWGYDATIDSRTVDWHVAELRRKLGDDPTNPTLIDTVRKIGYRLVLEDAARADGTLASPAHLTN